MELTMKECEEEQKQRNKAEKYRAYRIKNKDAIAKRMKEYRALASSKEARKKHDRQYQKSDAGKITACKRSKKQAEKDPVKKQARARIDTLVRSGKIIPPYKCKMCNGECRLEAHHWSYKKEHWEDVVWLCKACHMKVHTELRSKVIQ